MAHQVVLNWLPSVDAGPGIGYNILRGTTAVQESSVPINATPVAVGATTAPACTYTDTTVVAGTTYFYTVVTESGTVVSGASNEVSATIPLAPPTGLRCSAS